MGEEGAPLAAQAEPLAPITTSSDAGSAAAAAVAAAHIAPPSGACQQAVQAVASAMERSGKLGDVLRACGEAAGGLEGGFGELAAGLVHPSPTEPFLLHLAMQRFSQEGIAFLLVLGARPSALPLPVSSVAGDGLTFGSAAPAPAPASAMAERA